MSHVIEKYLGKFLFRLLKLHDYTPVVASENLLTPSELAKIERALALVDFNSSDAKIIEKLKKLTVDKDTFTGTKPNQNQ